VGVFKTRNGLGYTGLMAKEKLLTHEILIRLPKRELLTTKEAYMSELKGIF
jgi:hypothetical protein